MTKTFRLGLLSLVSLVPTDLHPFIQCYFHVISSVVRSIPDEQSDPAVVFVRPSLVVLHTCCESQLTHTLRHLRAIFYAGMGFMKIPCTQSPHSVFLGQSLSWGNTQ